MDIERQQGLIFRELFILFSVLWEILGELSWEPEPVNSCWPANPGWKQYVREGRIASAQLTELVLLIGKEKIQRDASLSLSGQDERFWKMFFKYFSIFLSLKIVNFYCQVFVENCVGVSMGKNPLIHLHYFKKYWLLLKMKKKTFTPENTIVRNNCLHWI